MPFPNKGGQDQIPQQLVAQGTQGDLFVESSYMSAMCEFMWRKVQRVADGTGAAAADANAVSQVWVKDCPNRFRESAKQRNSSLTGVLNLLLVTNPECLVQNEFTGLLL